MFVDFIVDSQFLKYVVLDAEDLKVLFGINECNNKCSESNAFIDKGKRYQDFW